MKYCCNLIHKIRAPDVGYTLTPVLTPSQTYCTFIDQTIRADVHTYNVFLTRLPAVIHTVAVLIWR